MTIAVLKTIMTSIANGQNINGLYTYRWLKRKDYADYLKLTQECVDFKPDLIREGDNYKIVLRVAQIKDGKHGLWLGVGSIKHGDDECSVEAIGATEMECVFRSLKSIHRHASKVDAHIAKDMCTAVEEKWHGCSVR